MESWILPIATLKLVTWSRSSALRRLWPSLNSKLWTARLLTSRSWWPALLRYMKPLVLSIKRCGPRTKFISNVCSVREILSRRYLTHFDRFLRIKGIIYYYTRIYATCPSLSLRGWAVRWGRFRTSYFHTFHQACSSSHLNTVSNHLMRSLIIVYMWVSSFFISKGTCMGTAPSDQGDSYRIRYSIPDYQYRYLNSEHPDTW